MNYKAIICRGPKMAGFFRGVSRTTLKLARVRLNASVRDMGFGHFFGWKVGIKNKQNTEPTRHRYVKRYKAVSAGIRFYRSSAIIIIRHTAPLKCAQADFVCRRVSRGGWESFLTTLQQCIESFTIQYVFEINRARTTIKINVLTRIKP